MSKGKPDQDNKKNLCMTYDCVFHPDVAQFCNSNADFKKFACDTAIDGVNKVVMENKEKISSDYKVLKHINCKGERPHQMMMKSPEAMQNELLKNMDPSKAGTKLQKEVEGMVKETKTKELAEKEAKAAAETALVTSQTAVDEEDSEKSDDERPTGIVQPKFKIVHSYPVDMSEQWGGADHTAEGSAFKTDHKLPSEVTVTIYCKFLDSMREAKLDINETTLVFEYPNLYYLDIDLSYKVDMAVGSAKFDKTKKTLTIRVPVTGSTDKSAKVLEQHYRDYKQQQEDQKERIKHLKMSELDETIKKAKKDAEDAENEDPNEEEIDAIQEAMEGRSKRVINMGDTESIDDKYQLSSEVDKSSSSKQEKDLATVKREDFLIIYKEGN